MKVKVNLNQRLKIESCLKEAGFQSVPHEHAFWRAKKNNLTVVLYHNTTMLLQGNETEALALLNKLGLSMAVQEAKPAFDCAVLGLDESGKGDYFGPLVLAAAVVKPEETSEVLKLGVTDSKKLTDTSIRRIYPLLAPMIRHQARIIIPEEYNELYHQHGNLNKLMVSEYIKLIQTQPDTTYEKIILDKFSQSNDQNNTIRASVRKPIFIEEKAEGHLAVAAASIIARFHFIERLEKMEHDYGYPFQKGCGKEAASLYSELKARLSEPEFKKLAKAHFKESQ